MKKKSQMAIGGKIKKPKTKEEKQLAKQMKALQEQIKKQTKKQQDDCPHLLASNPLSDFPDMFQRASIAWHRFNDGVIRGVCQNCTRVFVPEDKDYEYWRKHHTMNRLSEAASTSEFKEGELNKIDPPVGLDALPDEEIFKLFNDLVEAKKLGKRLAAVQKMDSGKD
jgi:hypothetical protein